MNKFLQQTNNPQLNAFVDEKQATVFVTVEGEYVGKYTELLSRHNENGEYALMAAIDKAQQELA